MYKDEKIAKIKDNDQISLIENDIVDITDLELTDAITKCIENNDKAIELYELYQFTKNYKYSTIFGVDDFDKLEESIQRIDEYEYEKHGIQMYDKIKEPHKIIQDNIELIVFNKKFEAIHPQTQEELLLEYPIVVAIHRNEKLIEIRFDAIKQYFILEKRQQMVYADIVDEVCEYIKENWNVELKILDMDFIIEMSKKSDIDNIKLISQYMNLSNGGKAQLAVGNNEEYILPFIGELKSIMSDYKEEFEKNSVIKEALEQFIFEKEETTEYPWIEMLFLNEIKTRNIHVKFIFDYMNKGYCLILHYYNDALIGMERMNHVTRFISESVKNES